MTFKRKMKKFGNKMISEHAKNPYYSKEAKAGARIKWPKIFIPIGSVAVIGLVLALVLPFSLNANNKNEYEKIYVNNIFEEDAIADIKFWDEKTIIEKYPTFIYNGTTYHVGGENVGLPVESKYVGDLIGDVIASGFDNFEGVLKNTNCTVYEILGVSKEAALLVRYIEDDHYYAYFNSNLSLSTIEDIYDKISPFNSLTFTFTYYVLKGESGDRYIRFDDFEDKYIYNMLLNSINLATLTNDDVIKGKKPSMFISYSSDNMGIKNALLGLSLYEDGYLVFTFSSRRYIYDVGVAAINQFKKFVLNNIKGYELIIKTTDNPA